MQAPLPHPGVMDGDVWKCSGHRRKSQTIHILFWVVGNSYGSFPPNYTAWNIEMEWYLNGQSTLKMGLKYVTLVPHSRENLRGLKKTSVGSMFSATTRQEVENDNQESTQFF